MRTRLLIVLCLAALPVGIVEGQTTAPAPPTTPAKGQSAQDLFSKPLLADSKLTPAVKTLLNGSTGYVDPTPVFADLTGDGKSDAVVSVDAGGTPGAIAVYVLSTDGSKDGSLRVVYRNQELYRATTSVSGTTLTVSNPKWSKGDDLWAPSQIVQRTYQWKSSAKAFVRTGTTTIKGPSTITTIVGPGTTTPTTPTTPAKTG